MSKVVNSKFDSETSVGTHPEPGLPTQIIQPDFEGRKTGQEALRATAEGPAWKLFPVCATFIRRGPEMGSDRVQRLLTVQMQFSKYVSVLYCSIYFSGTFSLLFITCFLLQNKAFMWCHFLSLRAECKWREVTVAHEETQKHIIYELGDLNGYQYLASATEKEHKGNKNVAGNFRRFCLCASASSRSSSVLPGEERARVHFNQRWRKMPESRGRRELVFKDKDCSVIW